MKVLLLAFSFGCALGSSDRTKNTEMLACTQAAYLHTQLSASALEVILRQSACCTFSLCPGACNAADLHQRAKDRASRSSSSSSSSRAKPKVQMDYDPSDERDTNFAALLALMGARGWAQDNSQSSVCVLPSACKQFSKEMKDPATKQAYAAILGVSPSGKSWACTWACTFKFS